MNQEIVLRHVNWYAKRITSSFDRVCHYIAPQEPASESPMAMARLPILLGVWTMVVVFGVFGLWAGLAPLASATVSVGQVVLNSNRKTIQHLEGGIVDAILVREGQHIEAGQPLVRLNETSSKARLDLFKGQYRTMKAAEARLIAERDGASTIAFAKELTDQQNDPAVKEVLDTQRDLFNYRRKTLQSQIDILNKKMLQHQLEIKGLEAEVSAASTQISLLNEEIRVVGKLLKEGNALKPRLLALQRGAAELEGKRGENQAAISRVQQTIMELELSLTGQKADYLNKVVEELKQTQLQLSDLQEKLRASVDVMNRVVITAPLAGIVTGLSIHTSGGVIQPGEKLMDIVPTDDQLIVEAKIAPHDIEPVRPGLKARIRLTAYKSRFVAPVEGTVLNVSADRFSDPRTGESYYTARIAVDPKELEKDKGISLYPGMPADVMIITGERTLLAYLLSPIRDSFSHAFREK